MIASLAMRPFLIGGAIFLLFMAQHIYFKGQLVGQEKIIKKQEKVHAKKVKKAKRIRSTKHSKRLRKYCRDC